MLRPGDNTGQRTRNAPPFFTAVNGMRCIPGERDGHSCVLRKTVLSAAAFFPVDTSNSSLVVGGRAAMSREPA
jgi:hypothetical protein